MTAKGLRGMPAPTGSIPARKLNGTTRDGP